MSNWEFLLYAIFMIILIRIVYGALQVLEEQDDLGLVFGCIGVGLFFTVAINARVCG